MGLCWFLLRKAQFGIIIILLVSFFIPSPTHAVLITFNDGQTHVVNYFAWGDIYSISDNINSPYNPTTVIFNFSNPTGGLSSANIGGHSIIYLQNGHLDSIIANDQSTVVMNGGAVGKTHAFKANDDSKAIITGGYVGYGEFYGSELLVTGGDLDAFRILGDKALILGGRFSPGLQDELHFGSNMQIYGGKFDGSVFLMGHVVDIYGGVWSGGGANYNVSGDVIVHGKNFNVPYGTYTAVDGLNNLTGILFDGTPLAWNVNITGSGTLTLLPEPSTLLLLGSGLMGLVGFRRKKRLN